MVQEYLMCVDLPKCQENLIMSEVGIIIHGQDGFCFNFFEGYETIVETVLARVYDLKDKTIASLQTCNGNDMNSDLADLADK